MHRASPKTRELLNQLRRRRGFLDAFRGAPPEVRVLKQIGNSHELDAVDEVLPFVLSDRRDVANAAAEAIHQILEKRTSEELRELEVSLRHQDSYSEYYAYEWFKLSPNTIERLINFADASVSVLGLATFHWNGYVREAAIKKLDLINTGAEIPYLLLRVNDWVAELRIAATQSIRARLKPQFVDSLLGSFALILRLKDTRRADHTQLLREIYGLLQQDENRPALLKYLQSDDRTIRRAIFRLFLTSENPISFEVFEKALTENDSVIRVIAAESVGTKVAGERLEQLLRVMKKDRFMPVRREALRIEVKHDLPTARQSLVSALLDAHPSMREEARYQLRKTSVPMDMASHYRQSLESGLFLFAAISGLGETGGVTDAQSVLPFVSHQHSKIRHAAIKALAQLDFSSHVDSLFKALGDESPRVSRQALMSLLKGRAMISGERLWKLFASSEQFYVKRNAVILIAKLSKWDSICYLLRALHTADENVLNSTRFWIKHWLTRFNRSFVSPTEEQVGELLQLLDQTGGAVDEDTRQQLSFAFRSFS